MRFDVHVRTDVRERLSALADEMSEWESAPRIGDHEADHVRRSIQSFAHSGSRSEFVVGGVDGSGDYPSLTYGDSFIYVTVAYSTRYRTDPAVGLREVAGAAPSVVEFTWLPEDEAKRIAAIDAAFVRVAGIPIAEVIERSDYRILKAKLSGKPCASSDLLAELIRPHASDIGNLSIQFRSTAELATALQLIDMVPAPRYVMYDGTLSLPFVGRARNSLFHEHLKRLCCLDASARCIGFFALSKSHGLPAIEHIERLAAETQGLGERQVAEHWYLRIPREKEDRWKLSLVDQRNVPPPGAVTYLVRFHRNVPVMRLDMDEMFWKQYVHGSDDNETKERECHIFEDLDYVSHDQRCYGYPYPIKAGHDRASLTEPERVSLRKMIIDAAVSAGMKRSLFRNASAATGHE